MTPTLSAYLNDPTLKRRMLAEMTKHRKADQIVKGTYGMGQGKDFRGCAIGCALHSLNRVTHGDDRPTNRHERFPAELGIPVELAYLFDHFFENLPDDESQLWPRAVLAAIPVGVDLSGVLPAVLQWSILDTTYGWMAYAKTDAQRQVVRKFAEMVASDWRGEAVTDAAWYALDTELETVPEWAWAWAWAWEWARAGARAGAWAWAWARAGARAGAWAWAPWYTAASQEVLRQLKAAGAK